MDDLESVLSGVLSDDKPAAKSDYASHGRYDAMYADAGNKYGVDPALIKAVAITESSEDHNAISRDANHNPIAHGLMQFTTATAKSIGLNDPYDAGQSIEAGAKLLKQNIDASGGDTNKALLMYHGGTNQANWGPKTKAYPTTVMSHMPKTEQSQDDGFDSNVIESAINGSKDEEPINLNLAPVTVTPKDSKPEEHNKLMSTLAGAGHGIGSLALGAQQLAGRGINAVGGKNAVGDWLVKDADDGIKKLDAENTPYQQSHPNYNAGGDFGGQVVGGLALPLGGAGEGAGLVSYFLHSAKAGAVIGGLQSVDPEKDNYQYFKEKAKQVGVGAVGGLVGLPIGAAVGKTAGYLTNKFSDFIRPAINKVTGAGSKEMELVANSSPELQAATKASINKGENINPDALKRQIQADSLPIRMSHTEGQATQDTALISNERNMRSANPAMQQKLNDQNAQLIDNLDHIRDTGAPNANVVSHIDAGDNLISSGRTLLDNQAKQTSALYKNLEDANGGALPMDGQSFSIDANKILGQKMKGAYLPAEIQSVLSDFQTGKQKMTFENFENLRTNLGNEARSAGRDGKGNILAAVNIVRNSLENMPLTGDVAHLKPLADAARQSAKQGFDMLENNPMLKTIDAGKENSNTLVQKFLVDNSDRKHLINLVNTFKEDPQALETMKAGTVNYLKSQAIGQTGTFSQSNYNKVIKSLGPKLDILFSKEEATHLRNIGEVAGDMQRQPAGSYVNNSNTDTANLARGAGNMMSKIVDAKTLSPVGSIINNSVQNTIEKKANTNKLNSILNIGAGASTPSKSQKFLRNGLPALSGQFSTIPISSVLSQFVTDKGNKNSSNR